MFNNHQPAHDYVHLSQESQPKVQTNEETHENVQNYFTKDSFQEDQEKIQNLQLPLLDSQQEMKRKLLKKCKNKGEKHQISSNFQALNIESNKQEEIIGPDSMEKNRQSCGPEFYKKSDKQLSEKNERAFRKLINPLAQAMTHFEILRLQQKAQQNSHIYPHHSNSNEQLLPYLFMIALSFHGIFEGIAIGLMKELGPLINLALAISLHKWAESLTLGFSFQKKKIKAIQAAKMIGLFALMTPVGIIIGWCLSWGSSILQGCFLSVSAGTFIYIVCTELVVEQFSISQNKWIKLFFYMCGIALLVGLWFINS